MDFGPVITSRTNARVKALRASLSGEARAAGDLLGIEGENLVAEALRSGLHFDTVYLREGSESVLQRPALKGLQAMNWAVLNDDTFSSAVDTVSPQGLAATVIVPALEPKERERRLGITLVLEAMQDPGNLGTLLRSAEAFGTVQVLLTPDCVNAWNPKTVRASAGSVFRVPTQRMTLGEIRARLTADGVRLLAAVAEARGATATLDAELGGRCAFMLGNEGAGLSAEALALADGKVHIPCMTESLNVAIAGSVLLYEAVRQRIAATIP